MNIMNILKNFLAVPRLAIFLLMLAILLEACGTTPTVETVEFLLDGNPLRGKDNLKVRCYSASDPSQLLPGIDENQIQINPETGEASFPADCAYVAVLYKLHEQPSWHPSEPAYRVYAANWDRNQGLPTPVSEDIRISTSNKLTLFNAVVSLEWQPDANYVTDLQDGLRNGSAYLYDVTDGQMAFGDISIYSGGQKWDNADLRFLASNDRRPSAVVGGIVNVRRSFTSPVGTAYFSPGRVLLGRYWNGKDAFSGNWAQPNAFRTIIHEWGHYALLLYDEYLHTGVSTANLDYCTCNELPDGTSCNASIMAYQYPLDKDGTPGPDDPEDASELWHSNDTASPPNVCVDSLQGYVHGRSDWDTLRDWGAIQGLPLEPLTVPSSVVPGPSIGVAGDFLGFLDNTVPNPEPNPTLPVNLPSGAKVAAENLPATQSYIIKNDGSDPSTVQILHQGQVIGPARNSGIELFGVSASDALWFSMDQYSVDSNDGKRYVPPGKSASAFSASEAAEDTWQASVDLIYSVTSSATGSKLTTLTVRLSDMTTNPTRIQQAQLCTPNTEEISGFPHGCTNLKQTNGSANTWEFPFTPQDFCGIEVPPEECQINELPLFGFVRVLGGPNGEQQLIRWYEDGGPPGPAHSGGDTPAEDGTVMVNTTNPIDIPRCSRVFVMPAADFTAVSHSIAKDVPEIRGIIGIPMDVDILLPTAGGASVDPNADCTYDSSAGDHDLPIDVTLGMFYPIPRLEFERFGQAPTSMKTASLLPVLFQTPSFIEPDQLRLLHFDRSQQKWTIVVQPNGVDLPVDRDENLGWIAQDIAFDGIFAIGWVPKSP